jgi:predicted bacteriocin transport accessory protein
LSFKQVKIKYLIIPFIILFLLTGLFVVNNYYKNTLESNSKISSFSCKNLLLDISQDALNEKILNKESFFIYIGRPTCPDCKTFMPKLENILSETNKSIFYYNTEATASKKQEIRDYLHSLNVKSVPSILLFSNGNIEQIYDCQDKNQVENFLEQFKGDF